MKLTLGPMFSFPTILLYMSKTFLYVDDWTILIHKSIGFNRRMVTKRTLVRYTFREIRDVLEFGAYRETVKIIFLLKRALTLM